MGEWGMLQSLQGLVGAFITASPRMVEWLDAAFDAVEAAAAAAAAHNPAANGSRSGSAAVAAGGTLAAAAGPVEGDSLADLQALLQVRRVWCGRACVRCSSARLLTPLLLPLLSLLAAEPD